MGATRQVFREWAGYLCGNDMNINTYPHIGKTWGYYFFKKNSPYLLVIHFL